MKENSRSLPLLDEGEFKEFTCMHRQVWALWADH